MSSAYRNRLRDAPLWVHAAALGGFAAATLASIVLFYTYRDGDIWATWLGTANAAAKWPTGNETHFAERIYGVSVFRTPANTFSNLGYVLVGLYILAYALTTSAVRRPRVILTPSAVQRSWPTSDSRACCWALAADTCTHHSAATDTGTICSACTAASWVLSRCIGGGGFPICRWADTGCLRLFS